MPLPKPTLDNRRFDQLVAEGRAQIPRLAPAWTDQNMSDPGMTLIELGAWLTEQNVFRFDRVSDETLRAFVRLLGIEPRMPQLARTVVALGNPNAGPVALPPRLQLGDATQPLFETTGAVAASPARLVQLLAGAALADATAANAAHQPFAPFGPRPRPGHALYLGFDRALDAPDTTLALHAWTGRWRDDAAVAEALQAEQADAMAHAPAGCPVPDWRAHYRVRTVWEFQVGPGLWRPLQQVQDETRALSLSGFVRFAAPDGHAPAQPGGPFFLRCRIAAGRFECPPRLLHLALNAVACEHALSLDEALVGTAHGHAGTAFDLGQAPVVAGSLQLRLVPAAGPAQTDWREVPDFERAGPFDKLLALDPERGILHGGNGLRAAVVPAGHRLFAALRLGGGPDGNLDAATLTAVPPTAHNQALLAPPQHPLTVAQPFPATGGAPRETLAAAQGRAFDRVHAVDKAVTLEDFERLARATPGVPVARVRAVAGLDPLLPCDPAAGLVTLIVIPPCPRPAPLPSAALLRAVERYLEPRRLVTSEVHAIAPRYRRVGVDATLHLACDADPQTVQRAAMARLLAFLDPLDGGPDGSGWPFGRTVYRAEVMARLAGVPGVARVTGLVLQAAQATAAVAAAPGCACAAAASAGACSGAAPRGGGCGCGPAGSPGASAATPAGRCDNVNLCPHELVRPGRVRLALAADAPRHLRRSDPHVC